jgi:hypothetical protein
MATKEDLIALLNTKKVYAYDLMANIDFLNSELRNTNEQIGQISTQINKMPVPEVTVVPPAPIPPEAPLVVTNNPVTPS